LQEKLKPVYLESLPDKLDELDRYLGSRPWFAGENITYVDCVAYEAIYQHPALATELVEKCTKLSAFLQRFEQLPQIEAYMKSDR
jgi:glutathione S-transferase